MILGVVLAGGRSRRFGSDKALAEMDGKTLLAHAVHTLSGWCEDVVIVGRETGPASCIADWPRAGMGPLGGIAAGLRFAQEKQYSEVLSIPVDAIGLPDDLPRLLSPAPAFAETQPVIGRWPVSASTTIEDMLRGTGSHAMRAFTDAIGARAVELPGDVRNINRPEDLPG